MWMVLKVLYSKQLGALKQSPKQPDRTFVVHVDRRGVHTVRKLGAAAENIGDPHYMPTGSYEGWLEELRIQGIPYDEVVL